MKKIQQMLLTTLGVVGGTLALGSISANADTVTVQAGDTVSAIAKKYDTTISDIQRANNLSNPNLIYVGQQLEVNGKDNGTQQVVTTTASVNSTNAPVVQVSQSTQASQPSIKTPVKTTSSTSVENTQVKAPQTQESSVSSNTTQRAQTVTSKPQTATTSNNYTSNVSGSDAAAKAWIAQRESSNNYNARNGQYIGKYQLSSSYLNGDYSPANQEKCADQYVQERYGSWTNAQAHWQANGWY
ncbi:aggregation-promoting factor [Ligilactobacillus sp. LYQ135]